MIPSHHLAAWARKRHATYGTRSINPMWVLDLGDDGTNPRLTPLPEPQPMDLPYLARTSGVSPRAGADNINYLLGKHRERWWDLTERCMAGTNELAALQRARQALPEPPTKAKPSHVVTVRLRGRWLHEHPTLTANWVGHIAEDLTGEAEGVCGLCGQYAPLARKMLAALPASKFRTTGDVPLYPGTHNLGCVSCAINTAAAFDDLVRDPAQSWWWYDQERFAIWWSPDGDTPPVGQWMNKPDPAQVQDWTGATGTCNIWVLAAKPGRLATLAAWSMPTHELAQRTLAWYDRIRVGITGTVYGINALHRQVTCQYDRRTRTYRAMKTPAFDEHLMWDLAISGGPLRRCAELVVQQTQRDLHMSDGRAAILEAHLRDQEAQHSPAGATAPSVAVPS